MSRKKKAPEDKLTEHAFPEEQAGEVECLGQSFPSEAARREHFTELLRQKLQDPEFRKLPGFPQGSDEAILRMSDPPYYTACPNPFLADFVRVYGKPYDPNERYEREPFAVDVSVGKTDALYKAHGYHTKVPHLAIVPSILHYTTPGDLVIDGFCGSGMTGLAAQFCGTAPTEYRRKIEAEWKALEHPAPEWGARRAILNDLAPAATFIAAGYNIPFDVSAFEREAEQLLEDAEKELGWMYECSHVDGVTKGRINFTVWSEVFSCPECGAEITFYDEALDEDSKRTKDRFACPSCKSTLTKGRLTRRYETKIDWASGASLQVPYRKPVLINYSILDGKYERVPSAADLELLQRIEQCGIPQRVPFSRMMHAPADRESWGDEWRAGVASFSHVHHLFLPRAAHALGWLWGRAESSKDCRTRAMLIFLVEQAVLGMSVMNRYSPTHFSQVNRYMSGRLRVLSQHSEVSPWYILRGKLSRLGRAFECRPSKGGHAIVGTGDCGLLGIPDESVDYIFTDPPFGYNFAYAELNFVPESWHGVTTSQEREAIMSPHQGKAIAEYRELMRKCFGECFRVLKPGRWMTVVFSNSSNAIWRTIQEAIGVAGFVVADVRVLDKKQGTFNQVRGVSVDQDLIITGYKPTELLTRSFALGQATAEGAWGFVREHLAKVPVFVGRGSESEAIAERTPQMLLDRMNAFHVQRGLSIPLSNAEFLEGLVQRFPQRDGMYFLPAQVAEYDKKRMLVASAQPMSLYVIDEQSAIQWLRQQLQAKPQSFQDLQPQYMPQQKSWAQHEKTVELKVLLEQNFLHYDGTGPVPSQIHAYLSTNFKNLRNLEKDDSRLVEKASGRWYVPDPNRQADVDQLREKQLLREFEELKLSKERRIKVFRTEAVRAGFKACWQVRDYETILRVAEKLPETVLQEDEKLVMYYDGARMRSDGGA